MLIYLKSVTVNKYKSIQKRQVVDLDPAITTIVGMNESGKTSFLQALAKTNYFNDDPDFKFDTTNDFPRNELPDFEFTRDKVEIIVCEYEISNELMYYIEEEFGAGTISSKTFYFTYNYNNLGNTVSDLALSQKKYLEHKSKNLILNNATKDAISNLYAVKDIALIPHLSGDKDLQKLKEDINKLIEDGKGYWDNPVALHLFMYWLLPRMPKFWYFDDYYHLDGRININELSNDNNSEKSKTALVLFELARIKPEEIINANNYERFIALFESVSNKVTSEINKYWSTNKNLDIEFRIQDKFTPDGINMKYLEIRVKSQKHKITLPLDRRSKGFNWFFSFIVWFSKVQSDKNSSYVILLDEPGLNLHATAQADLLRFIEDLSQKYQVIYTTHSPFMVQTDRLDRIRTCTETDEGTIITNSIQAKDPYTLLPIQAALGFNIAPELFAGGKHLLVESPADLVFLTTLSTILETEKRTYLKEYITIVPVGGLNRVAAFTALLQNSDDNVACLLNGFTNHKGKSDLNELIRLKLLKEKNIIVFDEFVNGYNEVNIEDLMTKEEYLKLFNFAFDKEFPEIKLSYLDINIKNTLKQIKKVIGRENFNRYLPANKLLQLTDPSFFCRATLDNFEKLFMEINSLF